MAAEANAILQRQHAVVILARRAVGTISQRADCSNHHRSSEVSTMATQSLSQLSPEQQQAAVILARQAAMREVKRRRQKQGLRHTLPYSVLSRLANEWLADHPELYAEALASPIVQELGNSIRRRRPDPKRELVCKSQVQNGGQQ
jgi:hypothetical protein